MRSIIIPAVLIILVGGFMALVVIADRDRRNKYDERQLVEQGRACKYAFVSMIVFICLEPLSEIMAGHKLMDTNVALWLCAVLGVGVFAVYCVIKDAYVTVKTSPWVQTFVMGLLSVVYVLMAVARLDGGLIKDGMLTVDFAYLAMAADFVIIFLTMLIKTLRDRRSRE